MKKICILGGGHGCSRLVKGFKNEKIKVDVIVTSSDNGGSSGEITKEFNVPALGDLRLVLESLLDEPLVDFFSYRFKKLHDKSNVSLGNLMLLSLILENNGDVDKMLEYVNAQINSNFRVHLSTTNYVELKGYNNREELFGETSIGESEGVRDVYLNGDAIVSDNVIEAIEDADVIVLSFGSLFTSLGAVITNEKINMAIKNSKAELVYIPNLVNQKETKDFVLENYVDYLENKLSRKIDRVIISNSKIKRKHLKRYLNVGRNIVTNKEKRSNYYFYPLLLVEDNKLRHNYDLLKEIINGE